MEFLKARAAQIARQSRDPARCLHLMRSEVKAFVQSGNNNLSGGGGEQPVATQVYSPPVFALVATATIEDAIGSEAGLEVESDKEPVQVAAIPLFSTEPVTPLEVEICQLKGFVLVRNSDEGMLKAFADAYGRCVCFVQSVA
jgi:hypothetical protein